MKVTKRITSLFLVFVMLLSMVPSAVFATNAAPAQLSGTAVSDPSTLDGWKTYFGLRTNALGESFYSTEYAGAVWSDKTVLTQVPTEFPSSVTLGKDNFLVALSALASNSEIVGYSSIPTDTILVLDMSSSMNTAGAIDELAVAANNAIKALYAENRDNRVGVVYYSGNDDTFILMPLDRYTSTSGNYVEHYTASNGRSGIRICRNVVKNSAGTTVNAGDTYHSGTFTQDGVYTAMKMLLEADKTVASGIQAGRERMPIIVLMTDGEPTHTTNTFDGNGATYDTLDDASWVSGIKEGTGQEFLTQLTAAYAKYMLENSANRYLEHELLFYTLGFDVQGTPAVLQPERATNTDTLWNGFLNGNTIRPTDNQAVNSGNAAYSAFRAKLNSTAEEDIRTSINRNKYRYYVDGFFTATTAESLNNAFQTIVQEIILQSRYSPTLVSGNKNMSGYLTMSDEIGEFMDVKNINGILLGDTLFTGAMLTKMMATDMFGNSSTFTEAGWELVSVVSERVGIDQAAAIDLLSNAWKAGQLSYTSDSEFSNYIGFYEAADGAYKGFFDESYGTEDAPEGAKYITRAYGFYGPTDGSIAGSNMLHIMVRLRTEIATGRQEVVFKIPSSLIPVVSFDITISGDNLDDPGEISLEHHEEDPIRLLFEVGLQSDITELNIAEKMDAAEYDHDNGDGTYSFYSNRWGSVNGGYAVDYNVPLTHLVADSHFHPSEENERYYFTENTLLCIDENGTPYTGSKPASGTFYHARRVFKTHQASDGSAFLTNIYVPVSQAALETLIPGEDGTWYIPKDTIRREITRFRVEKASNPTGTLAYSFYPLVDHPEGDDVAYDAFVFHGNNGKLTVAAATGIKLTKTIDAAAPDTAESFEFVITLVYDGAPLSGTYRLTRGETVSDLDFVGGQAKVTLKHGETVYVTGLPAGTTYTVAETAHAEYLVTSNATGTLSAGQLADVNVVNVPRGTGSLAVSKYVTHPLGSGVQIDREFTVQVTLTDPLGQPISGLLQATHSGNSALTSVTADANGQFTTTLKPGQTLVVYGLLEGSTAKVEEPTVPTGFTAYYWEDGAYDDGVVTIVKDIPVSVTVHNHYQPTEVYPVNVEVEGEKFFTGRENDEWLATDTFTFQLQKNVDGVWQTLIEKTITGTDADKTFYFNLADMAGEKFTAVGEYTYQVVEVIPDTKIPGVTYDRTIHNFTVQVTDDDVNGQLEISSVTPAHGHSGAVTGDPANGWTVQADFTNTYGVDDNATAATSVDLQKVLDNPSNSPLFTLSGWVFDVYASADATTPIEAGTAVTTDATGEARFVFNYEKADLAGAASKEYTYYIKEVAGSNDKISYSTAAYEVKVLLEDNGVAGMTATITGITQVNAASTDAVNADGELAFTNTYTPGTVSLPLAVNKVVSNGTGLSFNLNADAFAFELYDVTDSTDTKLVEKVWNAADGTVTFKNLQFSQVGEYAFRLSEVIPADADKVPGITYDPTVYHFHIHVVDNAGALSATVHIDESTSEDLAFTFTNSYSAKPVSQALGGTKVLMDSEGQNREITHGMFEFALYEGTTELERVPNSTAGTFTFSAIEYTTPGTYEYTIKELPGTLSYIGYSDAEYGATVVVADENSDGQLEIQSVTYTLNGTAVEAAAFTNTYNPAPTTVWLEADKILENRAPVNDEFRFLVYETGSDFAVTSSTPVVRSATNGADNANGNNVSFGGIEYTKPGVHYYVIAEDSSYLPKDDVSYDATYYRVTVVIFDAGSGQLGKHVTYNNGLVDVEKAEFTNVWHPPIPGTLTVKKVFVGLTGDKPNVTILVTGPDGFSRTAILDEDNDWTAVLEDLPHGEYKVQEVSSGDVKDYELVATTTDQSSVSFDNDNTEHTITVTNTYEERLGTLTVKKDFQGLPEALRPEIRVTVEGVLGFSQELVLNKDNNWTATVKDLAWDLYTVSEVKDSATVGNYVVTYPASQGVRFDINNTTATVTLTNAYESRFGTLTVMKHFDGDVPANLPTEIKATVTGPNGYSQDITLTAANSWTVTLENLAWGKYTVTENEESAKVHNYVIEKVTVVGSADFTADNRSAILTIVNTYDERFGSLTVEKKFDGDVPANLPAEIKATVSGPNGYKQEVSLTAANGWKATLTGLAWGTYTVTENKESADVANYVIDKITVVGNAEFTADNRTATVTITNTYDERFGSLTVEKKFDGDVPANLPAEIKATVSGPNGYSQEVILTAANNWTVTLDNLAWGKYTVTENKESAEVENYVIDKITVVGNAEFTANNRTATITITNTYDERFGSLTVEKKFDGDVPANLPAEIRAAVIGPNGYSKKISLTAANGWTVTLDNLPWGKYTVVEDAASAHVHDYVVEKITVSGAAEFTADNRNATVTITNTYSERFGNLTIKKVFAGDVPANLPAEIKATVTSNKGYHQNIILNAENGWTVVLNKLPQATYTVTEDMTSALIANYAVTGTVDKTVTFNHEHVADTITITNTYDERFGSLTVEKKFDGDVPANLPAEIKATVSGPNGYSQEVILTAANSWKVTLTDLAWGKYTVTENEESAHVQDYAIEKITVSGAAEFTADNRTATVTITNTYDERFGDLTIKKVFAGDVPANLPAEIKLTVTSDEGYKKDIVLTAAHDWTVHLYDLPQATYSIEEDMTSAQVANYVVTSKANSSVEFHNHYVSGVITVTNTYEERFGTLTVEKKFDGDVPANLPAEIKATVSGPNGYSQEVILTAANDWKVTLNNLAWGKYTVTENEESAHVQDYAIEKITVSGAAEFSADNRTATVTITNTYDERFGDLTIKKVFAGDVPANLPAEIKLTVTSNKGYRKDIVLTAAHDWTVHLYDLPQATYSIEEDMTSAQVANYVVTSKANSSVEFHNNSISGVITVTNTYEERFGSLTVEKKFDGDVPANLPAEIKATVSGPNGYSQEVILTAANSWKATLTDLAWGKYTVTENKESAYVEDYVIEKITVSGAAEFSADNRVATVTITNTYGERFGTLTINKVFAGDVPTNLPVEIKINVKADNGYDQDYKLNVANNWTIVLSDLPWGEYTVTEYEESAKVDNYVIEKVTVSGTAVFNATEQAKEITITNTYDERFGTLTVRKQFLGDLPKDLRPEVLVTVFGPNGFEQEILLNAANDWTVTLSGLPQGLYTVKENLPSGHVPNYFFKAYVGEGVTFTDDLTEAAILVANDYRYIPETGDTFDPVIWTGISGVSAIALLALLIMKRKKDDDEVCEAN